MHQSLSMAPYRAARHDETVGVGVEQGGALGADPTEGVLDVLDDGRQLDLGGQAVIEGDEDVPFGPAKLQQVLRDGVAAADDQRAAVDPNEHRADPGILRPAHVGLDRRLAHGLVRVGLFRQGPIFPGR